MGKLITLGLVDPICACGHPKSWHGKDGCIGGKECWQGFSCPFFLYPDKVYDAVTKAIWQGY